jgi:hypothetical protein
MKTRKTFKFTPTPATPSELILPLKQLETLCGFEARTHATRPAFDACLGKTCVHGTVVHISYEFKPGQVKAHFKHI